MPPFLRVVDQYEPLTALPAEATFTEIQDALIRIIDPILAMPAGTEKNAEVAKLKRALDENLKDRHALLIVQKLYSSETPNCRNHQMARSFLEHKIINPQALQIFYDRLTTFQEDSVPGEAQEPDLPKAQGSWERLRDWLKRWRS